MFKRKCNIKQENDSETLKKKTDKLIDTSEEIQRKNIYYVKHFILKMKKQRVLKYEKKKTCGSMPKKFLFDNFPYYNRTI